jgi:hypothetical protein
VRFQGPLEQLDVSRPDGHNEVLVLQQQASQSADRKGGLLHQKEGTFSVAWWLCRGTGFKAPYWESSCDKFFSTNKRETIKMIRRAGSGFPHVIASARSVSLQPEKREGLFQLFCPLHDVAVKGKSALRTNVSAGRNMRF